MENLVTADGLTAALIFFSVAMPLGRTGALAIRARRAGAVRAFVCLAQERSELRLGTAWVLARRRGRTGLSTGASLDWAALRSSPWIA